jgi:hypothetical protein
MLEAYILFRFPCFLLVSRVKELPQGSALAFPIGGANFTPNAGAKRPIQRQSLLVQYKQQANQLLSINSYTPLISGNDKISR